MTEQGSNEGIYRISPLIVGLIVSSILGLVVLVAGPGAAVLVGFAILPIIVTRWLIEDQRIAVMKDMISRLKSKQ